MFSVRHLNHSYFTIGTNNDISIYFAATTSPLCAKAFWNSFSKIVRRFDYVSSENACRIKSVPCLHGIRDCKSDDRTSRFVSLDSSRENCRKLYEIHVFEPTGLDSCYIDLDLDSPDFLKAFLRSGMINQDDKTHL